MPDILAECNFCRGTIKASYLFSKDTRRESWEETIFPRCFRFEFKITESRQRKKGVSLNSNMNIHAIKRSLMNHQQLCSRCWCHENDMILMQKDRKEIFFIWNSLNFLPTMFDWQFITLKRRFISVPLRHNKNVLQEYFWQYKNIQQLIMIPRWNNAYSNASFCIIVHVEYRQSQSHRYNTGENSVFERERDGTARASVGVPLLNRAMPKPECQRVAGSEGTYEPSLVSLSAVSRRWVTGTHSREAHSCFQIRLLKLRFSHVSRIYPVANDDLHWDA